MAEQKKEEKIVLERQDINPLRRRWLRSAKHKRSNAAVKEIYSFLSRHMKTSEDKIKIGRWLNEEVWRCGIKSPPAKIFVKASKKESGIVNVELVELSKKAKKIEEKEKIRKESFEKTKKEKETKAEEEARKAEEKKEKAESEKTDIEKEKEKILLKDGVEHARAPDQAFINKKTESMATERKSVSRAEKHGA